MHPLYPTLVAPRVSRHKMQTLTDHRRIQESWTSKQRTERRLLDAYGKFISGLARWTWFATITFSRIPPCPKEGLGSIVRWMDDLQRAARTPVGWVLMEDSGGLGGRWHCHALIAGVEHLRKAVWCKEASRRFGRTLIVSFDPKRGAAFYIAKRAVATSEEIHFGGWLGGRTLPSSQENQHDAGFPAVSVSTETRKSHDASTQRQTVPRPLSPATQDQRGPTRPRGNRAIFRDEPTLAAPFDGGRMARREHQMPRVLRQKGRRPYWYIRYRRKILVNKNHIRRKEEWDALGYCDELTKREAERLRDEIMRSVNREVYTIQSHIPFEDFVKIYEREHIPTLSAGARAKYSGSLVRHILPAFGNKKLCDIDTQSVQEFLNVKKDEGLAWWTRNDLKNVISSIFTKAEDWGYWEGRTPTRRTVVGRKHWKRERRILTDDQFRRLLVALPTWVQLMVMTAVSTGMRVSEVLGLKWRNVDFEEGAIFVRERFYRGDTNGPKSDKAYRRLALGHLVEDYLNHKSADAKADAYVFGKDGNPLDDRAILKDFIRPTAKRLGIYFPGFGWHSFRRQHITEIQEMGATTFETQAQAGHSRPDMTSDYTIVSYERRKQAVLRLQERLLGKPQIPTIN